MASGSWILSAEKTGDRSRYACGAMPDQARSPQNVTVGIKIHISIRLQRCRFPVINKNRVAVEIYQHETAATDVASLWEGHSE
jgi:hypothetical protein